MEEFVIHSLGHLFGLSLRFPPLMGMGWKFRGQADANWEIVPKAGRKEFYHSRWNQEFEEGLKPSPHDLATFWSWQGNATAYCTDLPSCEFHRLAYAQHHGLATRLLDWTTNPMVALYFAVQELSDVDGAVYAWSGAGVALDVASPKLKLATLDRIAMFYPNPIHPRIIAQSGCFSVHPHPFAPLTPEARNVDLDPVNKYTLYRLRIEAKAKRTIRRELHEFGTDHVRLFPGIEGLAEHLNWKSRRLVERESSLTQSE